MKIELPKMYKYRQMKGKFVELKSAVQSSDHTAL